jgi:glycine/D-amino acid oxidase-like deaminating enzyme
MPNQRRSVSTTPPARADASSTVSLWMATSRDRETSYPALNGDASADVAIVGGGIAGILAGFQLAERGIRVTVLEADRICAGVSGHTTAEVTSGHGVIYSDLASHSDLAHARSYADANQWGLDWIAAQQADCDLHRKAMLVFAEDDRQLTRLRKEFDVCHGLGLPVTWVDRVPDLPFETLGAIRYGNQVELHPRKFVLAMAERLARLGGSIHEKTRVMNVKEGLTQDALAVVQTDKGSVTARHVVLATNYPVYDPAMYFALLAPYRDYAMAVRVEGALPQDMSVNAGPETHAFRTHGDLLIVSGFSH